MHIFIHAIFSKSNQQLPLDYFRLWPGLGPISAACTMRQRNKRSFSQSSLMLNGASSLANWRCVDENNFTFIFTLYFTSCPLSWLNIYINDFTMSAPALPQISIQPVFRQRPEMKRSLIPDLVKNRRITPDIILQYCRSTAHSTESNSSIYFNVEYKISFWVQSVLKQAGILFLPVLKVNLCFHLQHLWSRPWWCDQPVHHHLTVAPRGRGRCRWPRHGPGRDAASMSCGCPGASPADYPDVAQHQRAHRQSLCCHIQGLCMWDKLKEGDLYSSFSLRAQC